MGSRFDFLHLEPSVLLHREIPIDNAEELNKIKPRRRKDPDKFMMSFVKNSIISMSPHGKFKSLDTPNR
jgi:hypothetical protein